MLFVHILQIYGDGMLTIIFPLLSLSFNLVGHDDLDFVNLLSAVAPRAANSQAQVGTPPVPGGRQRGAGQLIGGPSAAPFNLLSTPTIIYDKKE